MHDFFIQLALIFFFAKTFGLAATRFKMPAVMGELFAGILLGSSLTQWVEPTPFIKMLAELGAVLLLFEVGFETDLVKLRMTGPKPFFTAFIGVLFPFLLGSGVAMYAFSLPLLTSLFWGSALTATSIGITVRVFSDLQKQNNPESQIVLGAAVIDDILGVMVLALLYEFAKSGVVSGMHAGKVLFSIGLFSAAAPFAARWIFGLGQKLDKRSGSSGILPTLLLSILLFFSWGAHQMGAPELLGGFLVGAALSKQFFTSREGGEEVIHAIESNIKPLVNLFTPVFFVYVGLSLNLGAIDWSSGSVWVLFLTTLAVAIIGKLASGLFLLGESSHVRWAVGIAMIPRGEVGLVFAEMGRESGVFGQELYAAMIAVIAATTLLTPCVLRYFYARAAVTSTFVRSESGVL